MKLGLYRRGNGGFTIVEVMVAMVILAIGLLGMAGMTLMVIKGGTDASKMTFGTNLAADKLESLKDVEWADLGGGAGSCVPITSGSYTPEWTQGCDDQEIMVEMDLNEQGIAKALDATQGPYSFIRKWVVCLDPDAGGAKTVSNLANTNERCSNLASKIPPELTCNENYTSGESSKEVKTDEKKIKMMVAWIDKKGRCHRVSMSSVQVDI